MKFTRQGNLYTINFNDGHNANQLQSNPLELVIEIVIVTIAISLPVLGLIGIVNLVIN